MSTGTRSRPRSVVAGVAVLAAMVAGMSVVGSQPTVRAAACPALPAAGSLPAVSELPDPFRYFDGTRLTTPADWSCRRAQLSELLQTYEYGHLPSPPASVTGTRNGNTLTVSVQANGRPRPFPAIIMLNPLAASATTRGYAEVRIDPNSIAADSTARTGAPGGSERLSP